MSRGGHGGGGGGGRGGGAGTRAALALLLGEELAVGELALLLGLGRGGAPAE